MVTTTAVRVDEPGSTVPDQYLNVDNLHFKPICSRLAKGVFWASVTLEQNTSTTRWHGHVMRALSTATFYIGAFALIPITLIEAVSSSCFALIGIVLNQLIYKNQSDFLRKHSLKALSYSLNCTLSLVGTFAVKKFLPSSHWAYTVADHACHVGSAVFIQTCTRRNDPIPSRIARSLNPILDDLPALRDDIINLMARDTLLPEREREPISKTL